MLLGPTELFVKLSIASGRMSERKDTMNDELSSEDCVKLKLLLTLMDTEGA